MALALLYWGFNFLKGNDVFNESRYFYAIYTRVDGLTSAKPVIVNGYKVGQVDKVYFHPDGSGRLIVQMSMTNDISIPKNTIASIHSTSLLGDKSVELVLGSSDIPAESGDTLSSYIELSLSEEVNQQVAPLRTQAEKLFASMDTVLVLMSNFLDEDAQDNFMETFNSVRRSVQKLENTVETVDRTVKRSEDDMVLTIGNLAEITSAFRESSEDLKGIMANVNSISDSLAQVRFSETFQSLNRALAASENVMRKVDEGDGSLGKLVNDPTLYENLEDATRQLNLLLLDMKYNPKRYVNFSVFGGNEEYDEEEILEKEKEMKEKESSKLR